jgi:hypothetical protein
MTTLLEIPRQRTRRPRRSRRVATPLTPVRVFRGTHCIGQLLVGADGRLWRRGPDVPSEIALKVLFLFTRGLSQGELRSRTDGQLYSWGPPNRMSEEEILPLPEVA